MQTDLSHLGLWVLHAHLLCKFKPTSNLSRVKEVQDKLPSLLSSMDISGTKHSHIDIHRFLNGKDELDS